MPQPTGHWRKCLRAAIKIEEHLSGPARQIRLSKLPWECWKAVCQSVKRFRVAQDRGWQGPSRVLAEDARFTMQSLVRELNGFQTQLDYVRQPIAVVAPREIAADLLELEKEFEDFALDLHEKTIRVTTPSIVLDDVYLGPFQIVLPWETIGRKPAYQVFAKDPRPAGNNEDVTHPHVHDGELCEGEGAVPIKAALAQGRLLDFFVLVRQILQTYNPASAHVTLCSWNGTSCTGCGYSMSDDDSSPCERCDDTLCHDCCSCCHSCGRNVCSDCSSFCAACEECHCQTCLSTPAGTSQKSVPILPGEKGSSP